MFEEYKFHNLFWDSFDNFIINDPNLSQLSNLKFVHPLDWWKKISWKHPGIYILTGGRQIGKTTSTKLLIKYKLEKKRFSPQNIFYLPCDQIDDHHHLTRVVRLFLDKVGQDRFLLVLDEVTFVKGWDKGIKALADEGVFRNGFCLLTGSDTVILKDAMSRFPGRRGDADKTDFHLYPLTFKEYVELVSPEIAKKDKQNLEELFVEFDNYIQCGGFLRAINELKTSGKINIATFLTFEQWIKGDFEKRGKKVNSLEEVLAALLKTSMSQMTFSKLNSKTGGLSAKDTFIDYCNLLQRMDILNISEAFDQNTMHGFPKKAKKFYFSDPFIISVIEKWLIRERRLSSGVEESVKVESIAASNLKKHFPVYYIKADGEVDIVLVKDESFMPIEVKWSNKLKERDLQQIGKYENSLILTRQKSFGNVNGVKTAPLPQFLVEN